MRLLVKDVEGEYDYILIDPPSSYSFLSVTAMTAADWLLVCMSVDHSSAEDFHCLLRMVKYIRKTHKVPLKIAGLLFNQCKTKEEIQTFIEHQNLSDIKQMVYDAFIPVDDMIKQSIGSNIPVALKAIKSPSASAYLRFAKELHFFFN